MPCRCFLCMYFSHFIALKHGRHLILSTSLNGLLSYIIKIMCSSTRKSNNCDPINFLTRNVPFCHARPAGDNRRPSLFMHCSPPILNPLKPSLILASFLFIPPYVAVLVPKSSTVFWHLTPERCSFAITVDALLLIF